MSSCFASRAVTLLFVNISTLMKVKVMCKIKKKSLGGENIYPVTVNAAWPSVGSSGISLFIVKCVVPQTLHGSVICLAAVVAWKVKP